MKSLALSSLACLALLPAGLASKSIIDILSSDSQFTSLLKTLQRTRLIPFLNLLNQSTFFAPTNEAFEKHKGDTITREAMLYHLIVSHSIIADQLPVWAETALVQGDALGQRGQRLSVEFSKKKIKIGHQANVIKKDWMADNGVIHTIDNVLNPPMDMVSELEHTPELSFFASILPPSSVQDLRSRNNFTLFVPHNNAFLQLDDIKRTYFLNSAAANDVEALTQFASHADQVLYSDNLTPGNLSTIAGQDLEVSVDNDGIKVGAGRVLVRDHLAKNGVIHVISDITFPSNLIFTPRKYLIGLNATKYVELIDKSNMSSYIDTPSQTLTILAPRDDVFPDELPPIGSKEMKDLLNYHLVPSKLQASELKDGMLIETELKGRELRGGNQRAKVFVQDGDISFNDASVIGSASEIGDTTIFIISQVLQPPANAIQTTVVDLRLSSFIASIYSAHMDYIIRTTPGITLLTPVNEGFSNLGLTLNYLLLNEAKRELQTVIKYHIVDEIVYARDFQPGSHRYPTLAGTEIYIERTNDDQLLVHGGSSKGTPGNDEVPDGKIFEYDNLIQTGVIHFIDQVELPPQLDITLHKLLKGAKATTFLDMLKLVNMSYIVNTTTLPVLPPQKSTLLDDRTKPSAYSLLAPTDKAFNRINMTYYLSNREELARLVRQHIVPHAIPVLRDDDSHSTLLAEQGDGNDANVVIREVEDGRFDVLVQGAGRWRNNRARILAFGHTTGLSRKDMEGAIVGNVYTIDTVLMPHSRNWWDKWGWIAVTSCGASGGLFLLLGLGLKYRAYRRRQSGYEPLDNEED